MKKTIKLLLTAAICAMLTVVLAAVSFAARELGDVSGDGKVDVSDARLVLRFAVNLQTPENDEVKTAADVDGSGSITVADARLVLRAAVGLQTLECLHTFEWRQVDAVRGYSDWSDGTHIQTCTKCGATTGAAVDCSLGYDLTYLKDSSGNDILPTCKSGANYYQTCSVCGGKKQSSFEKLPHKYNKEKNIISKKDATCTDEGWVTVYCISCNDKGRTKTFTIPALGHQIKDGVLKEGVEITCARCNKTFVAKDTTDYKNNEFTKIFATGSYYYKGRTNGADVELAITPTTLYMKMPLDDGIEVGYLASGNKKYFETESDGKRYYLDLDGIANQIGGDDMDFPSPSDAEFDYNITISDLNKATEKAQVVKGGYLCTRYTFRADNGNELRVYIDSTDGIKLRCIETKEGDILAPIYFYSITSKIDDYMKTVNGQGTVLRGMTGLFIFASKSGLLG